MKYFMIVCHRGHCRSGRSTEIKFVFEAENLVAACENARRMPSVKHSRMVLYGREISKLEYEDFRKISAYERYSQHQKRRH
jgi:hypothetical protein